MPGRKWVHSDYRFAFNGKENSSEITVGNFDFGARILDSRVGRWLTWDPLRQKYPGLSPYNFAANCPMMCMDPDGNDVKISIWTRIFHPKATKALEMILRTEEAKNQLAPYMSERQAKKYGVAKTGEDLSKKVNIKIRFKNRKDSDGIQNGDTKFSLSIRSINLEGKKERIHPIDLGNHVNAEKANNETKTNVDITIFRNLDGETTSGYIMQVGSHEIGVHTIPTLNFLRESVYSGSTGNELSESARSATEDSGPRTINGLFQEDLQNNGNHPVYNKISGELKTKLDSETLGDFSSSENNDMPSKSVKERSDQSNTERNQ